MKTESELIIEKKAMEELCAHLNDVVGRNELNASDAVVLTVNLCAMTAANQYVRGEDKKEFRKKMGRVLDDLLRYHLPRIEV